MQITGLTPDLLIQKLVGEPGNLCLMSPPGDSKAGSSVRPTEIGERRRKHQFCYLFIFLDCFLFSTFVKSQFLWIAFLPVAFCWPSILWNVATATGGQSGLQVFSGFFFFFLLNLCHVLPLKDLFLSFTVRWLKNIGAAGLWIVCFHTYTNQ